jgi:tetratricopeptide (TPR) repeat protein
VVLAVVTVFAFRGVRNNDFVAYDDGIYVLENQHVQQGVTLHSIAWAFTTFYGGNWNPLAWISHMVDWSLYGRNPAGHHITSVCLHAANAVLLFLLLLYMTGYLGRSAMVAFLFALHPAHVESVAWIAERKDVLCTFFWFATLLVYAWYVRKPSWRRFVWVVCGFACALISKPMAVTLPLTLLLLDFWPLRRITFAGETRGRWFSSLWKLCLEKWPLFIMVAFSSFLASSSQSFGGAVVPLQTLHLPVRICNAAVSCWRYVRLMIWPDPLTVYYYYDFNHIMVTAAVLSALALILVTAVCWHYRKERPYYLIGWLWFLGTLVPVIGIEQVGEQSITEHFTYVPFIGLFIAIVWLAGDAVIKFPKIKVATQLLAIAVIIACAVKTEAQVKVWKDTVTLFSHALAIDPRGDVPNLNLGAEYGRQGKFAQAQVYLERTLVYYPSQPLALSFTAYCLMVTCEPHEQRNLPLAEQRLQKALRVAPDNPNVLSNLALWSTLMGRPKDAETYCRKAIATHPDFIQSWIYLGDALQAQGKPDEAAQEYRHVLAVKPDNYEAHNDLGAMFDRQGLTQEALKEFRLSLAIKPDQAVAHSQMGRIFMETHQLPEAVEELTQAVRFDPANASAHNGLGIALFQMGEHEKAVEQFSEAVRIDPAYAEARRNLDLAQTQMKNERAEYKGR